MATTKKKSSTKKSEGRSLIRSTDDTSFLTFRITHQTIYWLVLSLLVLALGVWVITLTAKVQKIYDQIDVSNSQSIPADHSRPAMY